MILGASERNAEMKPLRLKDGEVECVIEFKYLVSTIEAKVGILQEVGERIGE